MNSSEFKNSKITKVDYYQLENNSPFHTEFDYIDLGISLSFSTGKKLCLQYGPGQLFQLFDSDFQYAEHLKDIIKTDAKERWNALIGLSLLEVDFFYADAQEQCISSVILSFEKDIQVNLMVASLLGKDSKIALPLTYSRSGNLYIIFNPEILNPKLEIPLEEKALKEEIPKGLFSKLLNIFRTD